MKTKMVCIMCPLGCEMEVEKVGDEVIVSGNNCIRGKVYATSEMTNPERMVTSDIITKHGTISVKTEKPVPKELVQKVIEEIGKVKIEKAKYGEVIIPNVLNTGVNIVCTREAVIKK